MGSEVAEDFVPPLCGQEDDRDILGAFVLAEHLKALGTGRAWHHHVEKDSIKVSFGGNLDDASSAPEGLDIHLANVLEG
jgi:hypothetical protein